MATETQSAELGLLTTAEGRRELLKRAAKGDATTLPAIKKLLENPENIDGMGGNLARYAQRSFIESLNREDLSVQEAIVAKLNALRNELLGENPTPVERLLVERIAACWLQVQDAEIRYARSQDNLSIRQADYHQRRMDATNKRYLAAVKTLALVRKIAVPAFQVNIARRQVNVVTPSVCVPRASG